MGSNELWWCGGQVQAHCPPWRPHTTLFSDFKTNKQTNKNLWCQQSQGVNTRETVLQYEVERLTVMLLLSWKCSCWFSEMSRTSPFLPGKSHRVWDPGYERKAILFEIFQWLQKKVCDGKDWPQLPGGWDFRRLAQVGWRGKDCWRGRGLKRLGWNHSSQRHPAKLR